MSSVIFLQKSAQNLLALLLLLLSSLGGFTPEVRAFYSVHGVEVQVSFVDELLIWSHRAPTQADVLTDATELVKFMPGPLHVRNQNDKNTAPRAGFLRQPRIRVLGKPVRHPQLPQVWIGRYQLDDLFVIERENLEKFEIIVPTRLDHIYQESQLPPQGEPKITDFPCVRASEMAYTDKQYFGYFWSPRLSACHLQEGVHYRVLRAYPHQGRPAQISLTLKTDRQTTTSYPEYDRLINHETGTVDLHILFGADKDQNGFENPLRVLDWNAQNYRDTRRWLIKNGFQGRVWTLQDWQSLCPGHPGNETVEEFTKQAGGIILRARLFWGISGVFSANHKPHGYLCLVDDAFKNASLFFYNGHSGQGSNIHPNSLKDLAYRQHGLKLSFQPNQDRYQIYVLTGCSTLGYFTIDLFRMKKDDPSKANSNDNSSRKPDPNGTRNLDIFTNGTFSLFQDLGKMTLAVVAPVVEYFTREELTYRSVKSYQEILRDMGVNHLTAINGDEDNPNPLASPKTR